MERLFHISTTRKYLQWFGEDLNKAVAFCDKHQMDGIELGLTMDYDISQLPKDLVKGVHLSFYPMWLDFWRGDIAKVEKILGSQEEVKKYYGGLTPDVIVTSYKQQYARAKAVGAKYMVFHVCHIPMEESFSWQFDYTDQEVIDATIELINQAFPEDEEGPMLLFENLWWPGLTYRDPQLIKYFISQVKYKQKGYLLDVSHLILTEPKIRTEKNCYEYIKKIVDGFGEERKYLKGVHLNKPLPNNYRRQDHSYLLERYRKAKTLQEKTKLLKQHIQKLDPHQPFDHPVAKEIIDYIKPEFCVYETNPQDIYEMAYFIKKQNLNLGIKY